MLESVLRRTAEKLAASGVLDAAEVAHVMEALAVGPPRSIAELSALIEEPAETVEARTDED